MDETTIPAREELAAAIRASGDRALTALRAMPADRFEAGIHENGWTGRQLLAHVASIEWTYPRILQLAAAAARGESGSATAGGGIDAYNARQVARRADRTIDELLEEFARNRASTVAAVETADPALLAQPIRTAGQIVGPAALALKRAAIDHVEAHVREIAGA